jgi:isopentenyldiphosphate isomerase
MQTSVGSRQMENEYTTSDPQHELFDVLDERGEPTGEQKARGLVHRDGDWHGALHIWVGGADGHGDPFVIFQRRSMTKDTWPGALDVAIGGHIRAGESLAETVREAEEEIGLHVTLDDLTQVARRFVAGEDRAGLVRDREVQEVFALRSDQPLSAYRQHPQEIDAIVAIAIDDAQRLFAGQVDAVSARECRRDATVERAISVRRSDVAGYDNDYPRFMLDALRSLLEGTKPEPAVLRYAAPSGGA